MDNFDIAVDVVAAERAVVVFDNVAADDDKAVAAVL